MSSLNVCSHKFFGVSRNRCYIPHLGCTREETMKPSITGELQLRHELDLYEEEYEFNDPDLDDSVYNPKNDEFKRVTAALHRQINHLTLTMLPRHAMVARLAITNINKNDIAKKTRLSPQTVYTILKRPEVKRLMSAIVQLRAMYDGVSSIEREQLLWRIALNNEEFNPRTSIAAIAEINNMKTDTQAAQAKIKQNTELKDSPQIIIQLGDQRLLPTALDE